MKMKRIIFIILFVATVFLLKSFFFWGHSLPVNDVTQKQIITLIERDRPQHVHGIKIVITGFIDGSATVQRSYENKKMYEPSTISGIVNLQLGGDWYGDKCLILYEPSHVKSGKLKLRYDFRTL